MDGGFYTRDHAGIRASNDGSAVVMTHKNNAFAIDAKLEEVKVLEGHLQEIRAVACNHDSSLWATGGDDKLLKLWRSPEWDCINTWTCKRGISAIHFHQDGQQLFFADKVGDAYSVSLTSTEAPVLVTSHISMITDLTVSADGGFLVTSDRDDHIRVSQLPKAYNIQAYCVGHSDFVAKVLLLESHSELLISGGGDGTVRLWNFMEGKLLHTASLPCNMSATADKEGLGIVSSLSWSASSQRLAVTVENENLIYIYKYNHDNQSLDLHKTFTLSSMPSECCFDGIGALWVTGIQPFVSRYVFNGDEINEDETSQLASKLRQKLNQIVNAENEATVKGPMKRKNRLPLTMRGRPERPGKQEDGVGSEVQDDSIETVHVDKKKKLSND
eukprot:GILJ01009213.1.p1 GENE.GILJ01009213.1~~GILJ01009213.1.p1  ORF type:complete len:386 (-),score=66.92 GILJ01009213.1:1508-2665(-)